MVGMLSAPQSIPQGMMQSAPSQGKPYSGPVSYDGITEQAVNGVVEHEGEKYYISADGKLIWDDTGAVFGSLDRSGNVVSIDPETEQMLKQSGTIS